MRVGLVMEQALAPVPGGTGRYATELAGALARTAGLHDVVSGWTAWHRDVSPARVPGVRGPSRLPLGRRALVAAWERGGWPRPRAVDVVHALTPLHPARPRGEGARLVVAIHDTVPWTHPQMLTLRGTRWHQAMITRAARTADAVTVLTRSVADDLVRFVPDLDPARIHVLGAGVAEVFRHQPAAELDRRVAAELPGSYLLSMATLEPRKGLDVAIAALAELGPAAPPLLVAGPAGWGGVDPMALARERGLPPDAVRVLGPVPDPDLAVLLRHADALLVPSRAEGFGLPVVEAMAAGTPVICSDVAALAEVAGGAALLVAPGDPAALAAAIRESGRPEICARLRAAGRLRAAEFTWDVTAERAWRLYRSLDRTGT